MSVYMCMTDYHLASYSWDLHIEFMLGFRIAQPFPLKAHSHSSPLALVSA